MLATSGICTVLLSVYYSWSGDFQPQGRYIICAWIPIILAIETCFQQITEKLLQTKKSQNIFIFICIACSIAILLMAIYSSYPALFNGIMFEYNG